MILSAVNEFCRHFETTTCPCPVFPTNVSSCPYKPDARAIPSVVCSEAHTALVKVYLYSPCVYMLRRKGHMWTCICVSSPGRGLDDPVCLLILPAVLVGLLHNSNQVSPPRRERAGGGYSTRGKKRHNDFFSMMAELSELWRCRAGSAACQLKGRCIGGRGEQGEGQLGINQPATEDEEGLDGDVINPPGGAGSVSASGIPRSSFQRIGWIRPKYFGRNWRRYLIIFVFSAAKSDTKHLPARVENVLCQPCQKPLLPLIAAPPTPCLPPLAKKVS